ncbi:hypothetical protein [Marinomonas transparens]|nr:hypothetical protein [Marinomonas transparens]
MESISLDNILHLTAIAIIVCCFLVVSSRQIIDTCCRTKSDDQ